jgi:hypothetical protein
MGGGFMAVRSECLRDVAYPGEAWLGEMGHQFGWTRGEMKMESKKELNHRGTESTEVRIQREE